MEAPLKGAGVLPALALSAAALLALGACTSPALRSRASKAAPKVAGLPAASPTPAPQYPQERPVDETLPVRIRSRSLRYDQLTQETVFYGGVTATQDSTVLNAQELRSQNQGQSAHASGGVLVRDEQRRFSVHSGQADYTDSMREATLSQGVHLVSVDPYGRPVTVTGRSGAYSDVRRWAKVDGGVTVLRGNLQATALGATLSEGGTQLLLEKDVRAAMGFNRLQSQRAVFDQDDHSVDLEGDVRVRLIPSEVRSAADAPWSVSPVAQEGP